MQAQKLEFWYDFASTYAYLSAMRIGRLAAAAKIEIDWRPFLLGPIFKAQGWDTSPFNVYPAKGRYMIKDLERLAAARDLVFHSPDVFPQNSLLAARVALAAAEVGIIGPFTRAVFLSQFALRGNIAEPAAVAAAVTQAVAESGNLGLDSARIFARSTDKDIKQMLREQTAEAQRRGIFGAPSFWSPDGELFWGDDRLEMAIAWVQRS